MKLLLALGVLAATSGTAGCIEVNTGGAGGGNQGSKGPLTNRCTDDFDDVYAAVPDELQTAGAVLVGSSCTARGTCLKCAEDVFYQVKDIASALHDDGVVKPAATYNLQPYRFTYGTTRLRDGAVKSGASSALLYLPSSMTDDDTLVVVAFDTVGFGPQCAPSLEDPRSTEVGDDQAMVLAIAAHGYRTVVVDFAGMGLGSVPPGWNLAEDEAHSLLDATRAVASLTPKPTKKGAKPPPPTKVVLVGLGEGGHAVLSAQAMAKGYGLAGTLAGVVAFAPIWVAPRTWGAALSGAGGLNTNDNAAEIAFDLLYFYGHGELYDGPGGGVSMLRDDQRSAARDVIEKRCFSDLVGSIGSFGKFASDIFDPTFVHQVSSCAVDGGGASCHQGAAETWNPRFSADRPHVDPEGAPILVWQGGADTLVPPDRAVCGKDKLVRDLTSHPSTLTYCGDDKATHGGVVERDLHWVLEWIDHAVGRGSAPDACAPFAPKGADDKPVVCVDTPPNGD